MSSHFLFVVLLLWTSCSIVQSYPVKNQTDSELESDSPFGDSLTPPELEEFNNQIHDTLKSLEDILPDVTDETFNRTHNLLESGDLFEGDLNIPKELIDEFYGNVTHTKRAAVDSNSRLWPSGKVYYRFASHVSTYHKIVIRRTMDYYQEHTCLRFYYRSSQRDYIEFTTNANECSSDYIGCKGGKQVIKLGPGCRTRGIVIHEIGHAIGFWHEQSRPDRDQFVTIVERNIISGKASQFYKRSVDSHGHKYDYGSIMHYSTRAFGYRGAITIEVNNPTEYANQGRPFLGQRSRLSSGDIAQINQLYDNCPPSRRLRIYARNGHNLPDTDGWLAGNSDPYMEFVAYDLYGGSLRKKTSTDQGDESPEWYQWLDFGTRVWTKFTAKVWDDDVFSDDSLSNTHTWYVYQGAHPGQGIIWPSRGGRVNFDYYYQ